MNDKRPWWQRFDDTLAISAFWEQHGLMLTVRAASLFSLPIEGGFWLSVMGERWRFFAYALPFTLDWLADLLVYKYGRIQLTVAKGTKKWRASRRILVFVLFNAVQSWGVSAWQLNNVMRSNGNVVHWLFPLAFATIQPVMGFGAALAKAVQDGKYDEQVPDKAEQPKDIRIQGKPDLNWFLTRIESLNGDSEMMTPERVRKLCLAEYSDLPSWTTLYNWARRANKLHPERLKAEEGE